ncbi:DUF4231 domain-containing protein [Amycolatopsis japonica]|uniref:DUF4231 domain-containing protein n=1 Tax=Amycolatopsis japonica TaxID=208439 RepID=UPI00340B94BD
MNRHRWGYGVTELTTLVSAAAIPVVAAAGWSPLVSAVLGAMVLVATGVRASFQVHENWLDNRRLVNDIEHEAGLFAAQAPHITKPTRHKSLRCMSMICSMKKAKDGSLGGHTLPDHNHLRRPLHRYP